MFEIIKYTPEYRQQWDAYVAKARNATFLFYRNYMDYHSDRFKDYSLLFSVNGNVIRRRTRRRYSRSKRNGEFP